MVILQVEEGIGGWYVLANGQRAMQCRSLEEAIETAMLLAQRTRHAGGTAHYLGMVHLPPLQEQVA